MIAYFAATPLQVFNCMNIRLNEYPNEGADLYILSFAADLSELYSACERCSLFESVHYLSEPFNRQGRWHFMKSYLMPNKDVVSLLTGKHYRAMFSTRIGPANDFYYTMLLRKNPGLEFHYYEEGVGDYIVPIERPTTSTVKLINTLGYKNPFKTIKNQWLYHPEYRIENQQYKAKEIHALNNQDSSMQTISDVFHRSKNRYIPDDCRLIYFDQAFHRQIGLPFNDFTILDKIAQTIPKDMIYVKLHPVSQQDQYTKAGYKTLERLQIPWEVLLCGEDLNRVILAAVHSTAATVAKTMFGMEPPVLLFYPCFPDTTTAGTGLDAYYDRIRSSYAIKEHFQLVRDMQNVSVILENLLK